MLPEPTSYPQTGYPDAVAQTSVRMPSNLHARAKAAAERDGATFNTWLCLAIEQKLAGSLRFADAKRLDQMERDIATIKKRIGLG